MCILHCNSLVQCVFSDFFVHFYLSLILCIKSNHCEKIIAILCIFNIWFGIHLNATVYTYMYVYKTNLICIRRNVENSIIIESQIEFGQANCNHVLSFNYVVIMAFHWHGKCVRIFRNNRVINLLKHNCRSKQNVLSTEIMNGFLSSLMCQTIIYSLYVNLSKFWNVQKSDNLIQ